MSPYRIPGTRTRDLAPDKPKRLWKMSPAQKNTFRTAVISLHAVGFGLLADAVTMGWLHVEDT